MLRNARNYLQKLFSTLTNDTYRYYIQLELVSLILGLISLFMCLMNVITKKELLMWATLIFGIVCLCNSLTVHLFRRANLLTVAVFDVSIIALFTYFLITGGTAGFSPIWICILPCCGALLLGERHGHTVCAIMYLITVFFLWTPLGKSLQIYPFTVEFRMRFPVVYCSFWVIGFLFERIRKVTNDELVATQKKFMELSCLDSLTKVHNRYWFNEKLSVDFDRRKTPCGFLMLDIDYFKSFNDRYGHLFGDEVLKGASAIIEKCMPEGSRFCRWGGEEFLGFVPDCKSQDELVTLCERIRRTIEASPFAVESTDSSLITISIGAVWLDVSDNRPYNLVLGVVDSALYGAKQEGRNRVKLAK